MTITDVTQLPPAVREYYDRLLLMTAFPQLIHGKFAQKRTLPKKNGDTVVFRRYSKLDTVPVPLVDGITPPGAPLSVTDLKVRVDFYGNFVTYTNQVEKTVEDNTLNQASTLLAQNMGQTLDEITRDVLASTSSALLCSQGTNAGTPTELSKEDIDAAVMTLLNNDAKMISKVIKGSQNFATTPIRPAYMGFIHTALLDDLEKCTNFVETSKYGQLDKAMETEWGSTGNVRWHYTSVGSVSSATPAVYNNFIVGEEAYATVHLGPETGEFYVKPLGSAGSADPLNQRGSVGWQVPFAARILNDSFMVNLMSTHS